MNTPFLTYGKVRLLNIPGVQPVFDEVLGPENCYRKEQIPHSSIVLDVGGFCGEFGIWCGVERGCNVRIYEPSPMHEIAVLNRLVNHAHTVTVLNSAVENLECRRQFRYPVNYPFSARLFGIGQGDKWMESQEVIDSVVECVCIDDELAEMRDLYGHNAPAVVKIDCEGGEREIFASESWLDDVQMVMLEWHYQDSLFYMDILKRHGFTVETNEPNPEAWRGLIYAKRK